MLSRTLILHGSQITTTRTALAHYHASLEAVVKKEKAASVPSDATEARMAEIELIARELEPQVDLFSDLAPESYDTPGTLTILPPDDDDGK